MSDYSTLEIDKNLYSVCNFCMNILHDSGNAKNNNKTTLPPAKQKNCQKYMISPLLSQ